MNNGFIKVSLIVALNYQNLLSNKVVFLLFYVDDMLVANPSNIVIESVKQFLKTRFDIKDLGLGKKILGISISRKMSKLESNFSMEKSRIVYVHLSNHF